MHGHLIHSLVGDSGGVSELHNRGNEPQGVRYVCHPWLTGEMKIRTHFPPTGGTAASRKEWQHLSKPAQEARGDRISSLHALMRWQLIVLDVSERKSAEQLPQE